MISAGFSRVQSMSKKVSAAEALKAVMSSDLPLITPSRFGPTLCSVVSCAKCRCARRRARRSWEIPLHSPASKVKTLSPVRGQGAVCIANFAAPPTLGPFLHSYLNLVHILKQIRTLAPNSRNISGSLRFDGCWRACYSVGHINRQEAEGA